MGMSSGGDNNGMMAEINVTPFVDVMLVLAIWSVSVIHLHSLHKLS